MVRIADGCMVMFVGLMLGASFLILQVVRFGFCISSTRPTHVLYRLSGFKPRAVHLAPLFPLNATGDLTARSCLIARLFFQEGKLETKVPASTVWRSPSKALPPHSSAS